MAGYDADIRHVMMIRDQSVRWSTLVSMPGVRQHYVNSGQEHSTVGDVENIPRALCQDALKLAQN